MWGWFFGFLFYFVLLPYFRETNINAHVNLFEAGNSAISTCFLCIAHIGYTMVAITKRLIYRKISQTIYTPCNCSFQILTFIIYSIYNMIQRIIMGPLCDTYQSKTEQNFASCKRGQPAKPPRGPLQLHSWRLEAGKSIPKARSVCLIRNKQRGQGTLYGYSWRWYMQIGD